MQVFLKNVPATLSDDNLKNELKPFMNILGISVWVVDKPKRKPIAFISFLNVADGQEFIKRHGKVLVPKRQKQSSSKESSSKESSSKQPSSKELASKGPPSHHAAQGLQELARLHILSTPIYVERSKSRVTPITLQQLQHEWDARLKKPDKVQPTLAISCQIGEVSCGKMLFSPPEMELKFIPQTYHRVGGSAKFGRQSLLVTFHENVRMEIQYPTIQEFIADHRAQNLILMLNDPPRFYLKGAGNHDDKGKWERQTDCPLWPGHAKYAAHCLVYQLRPTTEYYSTIRALKDQDTLSMTYQSIPLVSSPTPIVEDYTTGMRVFEGKMQSLGAATKDTIPFPILFQVQTLVWNNYLHPHGALRVLEVLERMTSDPKWTIQTPITADSMKKQLQKIPYPRPGIDPSEVDAEAFVKRVVNEELDLRSQDLSRSGVYGANLPWHQTWVFKAMVTPTRILIQGPDPESWNRVLRMFPDHSAYFLRVSFCDEDCQDLAFSPRVSNHAVYERYRKILKDGIRIAGRIFSFLGFSHSSLRSHSTWFLAPFLNSDGQRQSRDTILAVLGDFSDIRIPAKCAARIGQAFSETPYAVDVLKAGINIRYIPDVKSIDGKRVFSDGVGTMSQGAMEEFWKVLPERRSTFPTCFQIRFAGVKGLLVLDPTLRGNVICVRKESMMKFPSKDMRQLGICDMASRPLRMVLNRQVIKILEDMGTNAEWFLNLQNRELDMLRAVTATALNTSTFLQYQDIGSTIGMPSFIKKLDKMGIDYRCDVFLKSVVEHVVLRELRLLKHKARIPVAKGVTLFGVMDETGFLRENEVYIAYDKIRGKSGACMDDTLTDGHVIVTRSPALHPGDIQFVKMVTPPEHHPLLCLRNCIVFSQKGDRDLPSQLSGGDLDGDLYNVIWDPQARPKWTFKAADYARVVPPSLDSPVTRDDIADFFIDFMKSDILGLIATRHQILADVQDCGTTDPSCIELAEMHSTAVDYSKTGIAVDWLKMPRAPRSRPDFLAPAPPVKLYDLGQIDHIAEDDDCDDENDMSSGKPRYHKSQKILGRLYREIDERKIWNDDIHRRVSTDGQSIWDQLRIQVQAEIASFGVRTGSDSHTVQAWKIRKLYEDEMSQRMWHFSDNPRNCITEAEAFCGSILNKRGVQSRQQREASIQLKEETERVMTWIVRLIRVGLNEGAGEVPYGGDESDEDDIDGYDAIRRSWACLLVGCTKATDAEEDSSDGTPALESFRVVAASCLLRELDDLRGREYAKKFGALSIKRR